jgi:glutathione synthase/RimK-type ligase-like ATP-grasp enzyme
MNKNGWECEFIPWDQSNINWNNFDLAIIRSTWDYQGRIKEFLEVLENINSSNCILENSLELVKWNIDKSYLKELSQKGIQIVPSLFYDNYSKKILNDSFSFFSTTKLIIKPAISANADDTFIIDKKNSEKTSIILKNLFANRKFIIQPFIENILLEGEYSLIFFENTHSHTLIKKPKSGDFRVQEEHGGTLTPIEKPEIKMINKAKRVLKSLPCKSLYSRIDFVKRENNFLLMEVELIEPSLYFNLNPNAAKKLSSLINQKFQK